MDFLTNHYIYIIFLSSIWLLWFKIYLLLSNKEIKEIILIKEIWIFIMSVFIYLVFYIFKMPFWVIWVFIFYLYTVFHYKFFWTALKKIWQNYNINTQTSENIKEITHSRKFFLKKILADTNDIEDENQKIINDDIKQIIIFNILWTFLLFIFILLIIFLTFFDYKEIINKIL
jgi:hypothetical protein